MRLGEITIVPSLCVMCTWFTGIGMVYGFCLYSSILYLLPDGWIWIHALLQILCLFHFQTGFLFYKNIYFINKK
ncbi:hypothetical protein Hanom_Chr09g00849481 [Helianthus anomalus]